MSLTRLFVRRPTLVFVLVSVMLFAGIVSTAIIAKQLFPNVSQPTITVQVLYNGASVTEMRDNIVAPLEQNLAGTPDLQTMNAVVQQGQATVTAIFHITSSVATDLALTQKAVQGAEKQLPTNITPPTVGIRDPSESTVITLGIFSRILTPGKLSLYVDNMIIPSIEQISGISYATVGGDVTPAYEVNVDPGRLAASGLTLTDVINTVGNDNQRVPGGILYEPDRETILDVRGDIQNVATLANLSVVPTNTLAPVPGLPSGGTTGLAGAVNPWTTSNSVYRVSDLGSVVDGIEPRRQYARITGTPGLFVQVQKASNASEVDAADNVAKSLPLLRKQFPDVNFVVINTQAKFTGQQIQLVTRTIAEGILLTGIAMIFFLRSWRSALVVCISIPTSLAIAITIMEVFGYTIDTISLLGMSLVVGILVDDSTVVLENIERHFTELKAAPEQAAIEGREEIGAAAVVITLVDVVVFFPIAFVQGQVGRNLNEFAIVVVISTLTSLFVSFTVTPTLAGLWALRSHWRPPAFIDAFTRGFDGLRDWYAGRVLPWALHHRSIVALFCLVTFIGALLLVPLGVVGEEFVPPTDRGQIYIQLTYPIGTPLTTVRAGAYTLEESVRRQADVDAEATTAGGYSSAFGGYVLQGNVAQVTIFLRDDRKLSTTDWVVKFRALARKMVPSATAVVVPSTGTSGGNTQPIDFIVSDLTGGDPTPMAERVLEVLRTVPGATSVNSSGTNLAPELSVQFDRAKAQALNVDLGTAAAAAGAAFGGDVATQFETAQGLEQVQVIYPIDDQHTLDSLRAVPIRTRDGGIVHLGDIAEFDSTPTAPLITRTNRYTVIHVDANILPNSSLSNVQRAFLQKIMQLHLPSTISVAPAPLGQQDFMNQTLVGLGTSLIFSVILIFLLMVALYNSYRSPFIILFSVPLAAVGALTALALTHQTLNLFSLIGTILLVGIAAKNGILLVDYANTLRARGRDEYTAITESAFTRFRPIIMTSLSVVAGNIPLALALEPGSQQRASLGIVVIGGVLSSLVLTLLLVPIVYLTLAPREVKAAVQTS
jgi:hydrophobic/amphiphilic exporter-1 (mainly G- bacteria), HAE1 family